MTIIHIFEVAGVPEIPNQTRSRVLTHNIRRPADLGTSPGRLSSSRPIEKASYSGLYTCTAASRPLAWMRGIAEWFTNFREIIKYKITPLLTRKHQVVRLEGVEGYLKTKFDDVRWKDKMRAS